MALRTGATAASRLALRRFHHSGTAPVKVLLLGDRDLLLADLGGSTPAERVADRIWLSTRRGVDVDVLGDLAPVLRAITGVFGTWRLWRYDVVVVVLGAGREADPKPRTLQRVGELLQQVVADAADATEVLVVGPAPARRRVTPEGEQQVREVVRALASERVRLVPAPWAEDSVERARSWAALIGSEVARSVAHADASVAAGRRGLPDDEVARQQALDELAVVGSPPDPRLDDLVQLARTAFGTESAEINFLDRDRQWKMAVAGADRGQNDRAHSFCNQTIRTPDPLIVGDAWLDPVLRSSPLAHGAHPIRFYAAHPIESAEGYRIGSFCVYDPEPRDVSGLDVSVLRDLALLAQAELIAQDSAPSGGSTCVQHG